MFAAVDEGTLLLCIGSPKDEDEVLALFGQAANGGIGKGLPTLALVRTGLMGLYGERGIEQQYALACPAGEVAIWGEGFAKVALYLLKDVL